MNRDIEFRGLTGSVKGDIWVYGTPYKVESLFSADERYYIRNKHADERIVDPKTIGQYTGLTDKNGKKIFEGDILRTPAWLYGEEKVCICIYNQEHNVNSIIGFGLYTNDVYFKKYQELVECDEWDEFEVIGNIYENKELLEG